MNETQKAKKMALANLSLGNAEILQLKSEAGSWQIFIDRRVEQQ